MKNKIIFKSFAFILSTALVVSCRHSLIEDKTIEHEWSEYTVDYHDFDSQVSVDFTNSTESTSVGGNLRSFIECRSDCKVIVQIKSSFVGASQPTISFKHSLYKSPEYILSNGSMVEQSWRIPPSYDGDYIEVSISLADSTIEFDYFDYFYEPLEQITFFQETEIAFDSHLGFIEMCPENTKSSIEMSGLLGYQSCIVVPKITKDGVMVCIHDDSINRTALLNSGEISEEIMVSDLTYSELLEYDFGAYKNDYYKNEKILLVDDFFALCKRYNMKPIFSTHPELNKEQWGYVKELLIKHNLLNQFTVKGFWVEVLETAFQVLGYEIMGYTGDNFTVADMDRFVENNSIVCDNLNLIIETEIKHINYSLITDIKSHGYTAYAFTINSNFSEFKLRELIDLGITGFVDDSYCQYGMRFLNF